MLVPEASKSICLPVIYDHIFHACNIGFKHPSALSRGKQSGLSQEDEVNEVFKGLF